MSGAAVRWLAGSGYAGFGDGQGDAASFHCPAGVCVDADGDVLVADEFNHRIRIVSAGGAVATVAGRGDRAWADGPAAAASFNHPCCLAVDAAGNIYVTDRQNNCVRRITPDCTVQTLAGSGFNSSANGRGTEASFDSPIGIAVCPKGYIFVSESYGHCVRRIAPDGTVTTLAGTGVSGFVDGPARSSQFSSPSGLTIDAEGNLFVADARNHRIRKVTQDGKVSTVAGNGGVGRGDGPGDVASFNCPLGVAVDIAGNIVVADSENDSIRLVAPDGTVSTLATGLNKPCGVALSHDGHVVVSEFCGDCLRLVDAKLRPPPHLRAWLTEAQPSLAADFRSLLQDAWLSDVTFNVGGEEVCAHRAILAARCEYFAAMFRSEFKESVPGAEVAVCDASAVAFRVLLAYLYTDELEVDEKVLVEVMVLANRYNIKHLQTRCFHEFRHVLKTDNAIHFFLSGHTHGVEIVRTVALKFIRYNFRAIREQSGDTLELLTEHPQLAVELLRLGSVP